MNLSLNMLPEEEIKELYIEKYIINTEYKDRKDSGIDLFCPEDVDIYPGETKMIDFKVKCTMNLGDISTGFLLIPRSSISKTTLRLANSVGVIDVGYRGNIKGVFDNISKDKIYKVKKGDRLVQICSAHLFPLEVKLVDSLSETIRGEGGFGSTGN